MTRPEFPFDGDLIDELLELWQERRIQGQKGADKAMDEKIQRLNDAPRLLPWHRLGEGKYTPILAFSIDAGPHTTNGSDSAQGHMAHRVARNHRNDVHGP